MLDDVGAVLKAAGSERTVLFGEGADGGSSVAVFAASFRIGQLRSFGGTDGLSAWAPDYPWGWTEEQEAEAESLLERAWGTSDGVVEVVQSVGGALNR